MKFLLALILSFFVTSCAEAQTLTARQKYIQEVIFPVVEIFNADQSHGSGFIIKDHYVVTARHVVASLDIGEKTKVIVNEGMVKEDFTGVLVEKGGATDSEDWAILDIKVPEPDHMMKDFFYSIQYGLIIYSAKIAPEEWFNKMCPGDPVYKVGYPGESKKQKLVAGILGVGENGLGSESACTYFGGSGGPLFNSDHEVIGIVVKVSGFRGEPIIFSSMYVPIENVLPYINNLKP
jgi:S1-C subfamily serine protease